VRIDFRRWGVFNLVGIGGFVVQICAIALLTRHFGWSAFAATAVGLELAALQNFVGHSLWTWGDRPVPTRVEEPVPSPVEWPVPSRVERRVASIEGPAARLRGWLRRCWRYQLAKTATLAANLAITTLLIHAGLPAEIANTAAVLACALPNYLVSEHLVFRHTS
jgi:putative flippase GtrA